MELRRSSTGNRWAAREYSTGRPVRQGSPFSTRPTSRRTPNCSAVTSSIKSARRDVREQLGAVQTGLTHYRLRPGRRQGWAHRHRAAEEIYVALSGSGRIRVEDALLELGPLDAVRVAPGSERELEAGPDGLEVLAFGSHVPGDGEMVTSRSTT